MKLQIRIFIITVFFSISVISGQTRKLNDPSIVSHYKRNTYEKWGDWRPYPKYNFLGIQTNFAYATVWGIWAPARNRRYKKGEDIRPLKSTGEEVQRLSLTEIQKLQTEEVLKQADTLQKRSIQDFAHWTSVTVDADPLWLLYYKKMLKPLKDFPNNPQSYSQWGFPDDKVYTTLISSGVVPLLKERLDILKDKYDQSRTMDMPRGKRFLMYHEILKEWREFDAKLKSYSTKGNLFQEYKDLLAKIKTKNENFPSGNNSNLSDIDIVKNIMTKYKHQF